ncbi:MAG TPA: hypothetical protein VJ576_09675 [Rhodocyclaceae bacterium]|nr:hypothetical protein [Rhodocyclaceae bacterium]
MTELALFASCYFLVLFLGLQSLNVNGGHYRAAFITSFGIGLGNLVVLKLAPNASASEMAAYLMGGPFGIVSSMALHRRLLAWRDRPPVWIFRLRRRLGALVCRFRGHNYGAPVFRLNCLYPCTRCGREMFDRTFDDIEPLIDDELEELHREMEATHG